MIKRFSLPVHDATIPADHFAQIIAANVDNTNLTDAEFREMIRNTLPIVPEAKLEPKETKDVARRRKPNLHGRRWPPNMSVEDIDKAIDDLCGCAGKWDCDCVSVTSQACGKAWETYNTRER